MKRLALTGRALLAVAAIAATSPAIAAPRDVYRAEIARAGLPADIEAFYRARAYRPVWILDRRLRPEAVEAAGLILAADQHGLSPARYGAAELQGAVVAAQGGERRALAKAELLLTDAIASYIVDLHRPSAEAAMTRTDSALPRPPSRQDVLAALDDARPLADLQRMHPVYQDLLRTLSLYRTEWSRLPATQVPPGPVLKIGSNSVRVQRLGERLGAADKRIFDADLAKRVTAFQAAHGLPQTGRADAATLSALNAGPAAYERKILANLDRARALPAEPGERHLVVDAGGAEVWIYEGRRRVDQMKAVVGKPGMQTPQMAGVIRYAVLDPYWNIPEDLVRKSVSPRIVKLGAKALRQERLEVLSDWTDTAEVINPTQVDWRAVAAGRTSLRVRQRPGPANMMGKVKFMLPNRMGVYLHDTPNKAPFATDRRFLSSGCVRLEDASRLGRWLQGGPLEPDGRPERRVDLDRPTPIYITYFTVAPGPDGRAVFRPDVYGRDPALAAAAAAQL